ncbi:hypothetical protein MTO96_006363 [Rhipicephalus appendiculatus]
MRLRRLGSLLFSDHHQCAVAASNDFVQRCTRQAESLALFKGDIITNMAEARKYWTAILHSSFDGRPLAECPVAKGSTTWLCKGTTFLKGRDDIGLVEFHIATIPNLTRLKRGVKDTCKKCRAGCVADESLGNVLQQCHRTPHQ